MKRRNFLLTAGAASSALASPFLNSASLFAQQTDVSVRWLKDGNSGLFTSVACEGKPLSASNETPLIRAICRVWKSPDASSSTLETHQPDTPHGPLDIELKHRLQRSGSQFGEDLLNATVRVRNTSDQDQQVEVTFVSEACPDPTSVDQSLYIPLNVAGFTRDKRFASLGMENFLSDCNVQLERNELRCHYLEPMASYPSERTTTALMLVPVVDISSASQPWRIGLFTKSDEPMRFRSEVTPEGKRVWHIGRVITIPAGETIEEACWMMVHRGDASVAWKAFHEFAHDDPYPRIDWTHEFKVHYYDFLSSAAGKDGVRGDGYDADVKRFREFHVGMGTQHGFYPYLGDFIHPDRKTWYAMQGDEKGPAEMSLATMARRIKDTRAAGAKAAIYMHLTLFDDASPLFSKLADCRRVDSNGKPMTFPWNGPDVKGQCWWMSIASEQWRDHLLEQARWIMEILGPDAICMDETFAGIGYDEAPDRAGPISPHAIDFFKELHALVRSFGDDKAIFTSDCSRSPFCLWADGDVGDHAYGSSLGNPLYRQEPVRYLAALGDKAWRPCAWHFRHMWKPQMALARQVGSGVGVSNGWIEYTGLNQLPAEEKDRMIRDIESLL
ncbi:hypothetical protein CA13_59300 [Planctomycetes bacterium CA13]|uniref:Glycoside hydrolase 123 C-terminal domain-containing protein n=1 Tax=Novipirellula herctigrandis TaxID=2527986 RepID=A0A5C5ZAX6_9BACT|nr:hypothetical protein CA13_59300 [Planctomycetes bacterium CA13]